MIFKKLEIVGISSTGFLRMTKVGDMGGRLAENTMSQLSRSRQLTIRHVACCPSRQGARLTMTKPHTITVDL